MSFFTGGKQGRALPCGRVGVQVWAITGALRQKRGLAWCSHVSALVCGCGEKGQLQGCCSFPMFFLQCSNISCWVKFFIRGGFFLPFFFILCLLVKKKGNKIILKNFPIIQTDFPFPPLPPFLSLELKTLIILPALWGLDKSQENEQKGKQRQRKIEIYDKDTKHVSGRMWNWVFLLSTESKLSLKGKLMEIGQLE